MTIQVYKKWHNINISQRQRPSDREPLFLKLGNTFSLDVEEYSASNGK